MHNFRRRWSADEDGMSLVEIMIAIFVLSVAVLALASTAITSVISLRVSRSRQEATDAASAMIENLRRTSYTSIAMDESDPAVASLLSSTGGCSPDYQEGFVTTSLAGQGIPLTRTFGPSGRVTVRTTVSWFDQDEDNACPDTDDQRAKRVRVVASWVDQGETFTVEESTIVAPVARGLPAPDFRLGTPDVVVEFTEGEVAAEAERCVGHVLRNLGAADGYDWEPLRTDGIANVQSLNNAEYSTQNSGGWTVRAFFENPAVDPPLNPEPSAIAAGTVTRNPAGLPAGLELMVDTTGDGDDRPETDPATELATGDDGRLWICYRAAASLSVGLEVPLDIVVRSQFDPNRFEVVHHVLRVTNDVHDWYLYDDGADDVDGPRVVGGQLPVLTMGPETTLEPERLGDAATVPNYDTDLDPTFPGLRLAPTASFPNANTVAFHQQVTPGVTYESGLELHLWSASEGALTAASTGSTVVSARLYYRVRLQVLHKNENNVEATPLDITMAYDHTAVGWSELTIPLALAGPLTLSDQEYLRLEITCLGTSEDTCHLAFDTQTHDSHLRLVVQ